MKYLYTTVILLLMTSLQAQETTTIYLIRHAEKADASPNTELSDLGKARANKWMAYFSDKNISAIYATPYKRTNTTVAPLAKKLKLDIISYNPLELELLAIAGHYKGKSVLIVGHSNTLPGHVNKLLNANQYKEIEESEFGTLYTITITINGNKVTHNIKIL